ncbi:MAG: LysR family transcriptional regulator [Desulfuromonadales bacterium]
METRYLATLAKVAETGSFSKTAQELHVTQSAVSQRIKFLEEQYGKKLFDRSGQILKLTQAGAVVLKKAQEILEIEKELEREFDGLDGCNDISLCCTPTFGSAYLPQVINTFMLANADIGELKFLFNTPEKAIKGLIDNEYDLAIIEHCDDLDISELKAFPLPLDELIFVTATEQEISESEPVLDHLFSNRLFIRKDGCSSKKLLMMNLAMSGKELGNFKGITVSDDHRLTIEAVIRGEGTTFISRSLVEEHLAAGRLRSHRVKGFCHQRNRTVVVNRFRTMTDLTNAFLECILGTMKTGSDLNQMSCPKS